jgi:predicted nucleic acid-binding protein
MAKLRTFLDANIVITAFGGLQPNRLAAMEILRDSDRALLVSDYLRLELIARPTYRSQLSDRQEALRAKAELQFMLEFFAGPVEEIPASPAITRAAVDLACRYGLGAMDALHLSSAIWVGVDEFVTSDQKLRRVREINIKTI